MPPPARLPIGRQLALTARVVSRAFDEALTEAGGSVPVWLVLLSLKTQQIRNQRELADAVGIREATLTHHLHLMDSRGLITRRRDPTNRRVHLGELTPAGEAAFDRLRGAAAAFDLRLCEGFSDDELTALAGLLQWLERTAAGSDAQPVSAASC